MLSFEKKRMTGAVLTAAALGLSACGGGDSPETDEVATLRAGNVGVAAGADATTFANPAPADQSTPDEAALEFSQCMRDEGLDFPDLTVDAEGNVELRDAFQSVDREEDGFREAMDGCRDLLQQAGFGGGRRDAEESTEVQDALLAFSDCVREAGYDVGDLELGRPAGRASEAAGDAAGDGEDAGGGDDATGEGGRGRATGERQGGFGNRSARYADNLGLDYEDPDVQATIDGCVPIVEEAFEAAGRGAPGDRPQS